MSNISRLSHNVDFLSDQFNVMSKCHNNQVGMKLLLNQDNNRKSTACCVKKIYCGDVALSDDSPVTITQVCCNGFKPASNDDEIAIDGQKTRKPRSVINEKWSIEEDGRLAKAVKEHGAKNWKNIAKIVGGSRTDVQCLHRWRKVISPELVKGPWTADEDKVIIEEVEKVQSLANVKWSEIAQRLHGRIGKQCRERYLNYLDSSIKRCEWTEEEDRVLFEIQRVIGNRWCEIAKVLPGRSENNVKNRYNSKMRNVYLSKYPNQMIPSSIIIEQQIEDPIHNSKKRRILCPAVKNLLKYLDLSKEYFDNLNNYSNMKNNSNSNISFSIQPSTSSSALILSTDKSRNFNNNNNNISSSIQIKQQQQQHSLPILLLPSSLPQKRSCREEDCEDIMKCKKQKIDSTSNIDIDYSIDSHINEKQQQQQNTTLIDSSKPKVVVKQYQLRKRRKNGNYNNIIEKEKENVIVVKEEKEEDLKLNNNDNNSLTVSPRAPYSDDSMLLSSIVDEEEAYKNFVETIPDNNLKYFNNNNSLNNTSIVRNYNTCLSNNFSDCSTVEDELNSSCLDCFQ